MQEAIAPLVEPATAVALRRHVVLWSWDAGALRTARPCRCPGKPGPARVRAHLRREAEPCPHLATARPGHGLAVRGDHALQPRRRVHVAARPSRFFPRTHAGRMPHARGDTHTRGHPGPSRTGSGSHTRSGGRPTSGPRLLGEAWGAAPGPAS
jgi:hypothetical protein